MKSIFANLRFLLVVLTGTVAFALPAAAADVAGTFQFVIGDVQVRSANNAMRPARKGDSVREGETIVSGANGEAQLRMVDDAYVAVRRDTQLRVDEYRYSGKNDASERGVLSLVKGTFRALTGLIVRNNKQNYTMKTAVSTIGIRGSGNITNHNPDTNTTTNHTVTGSHGVTSTDPVTGTPIGTTIITNPGVTVEIRPGLPAIVIPTPNFILAEASSDPKDKKADAGEKKGEKPAPRSDAAVKAEQETREATAEAPKDAAPPPPPAPASTTITTLTPPPSTPSTSEQQLLQANLRTQIEGAFLQAQAAAAGLATLAAAAQAAATNATTAATSAAALTGADLTTLDSKIATATSLLPFAPSIQSSITAAQAQRTTAFNSAGVVGGVLNPTSTLVSAQTAADSAALAANTAANAVPGLVSTANADLAAVQATYDAALAALTANDIVQAQQLLDTLLTQVSTAVASAGAAASTAGTAQTAASTAASQLSTAQSAVTTANSSAGTAVATVDVAINTALGNVQAVASAAVSNATAIDAINTALGTASGTTAQQAYDAAGAANTTAQASATTIAGIAAINTATASSNLSSVTTLANTAQGQVTAAVSANTANSNVTNGVGGTDFRDSQAAPALTAMNTANTTVQGALTTATNSNSTAGTQSTDLTTAKSSAATQAGSATTAFSTATTTFNSLTAAAQVDAGLTNANQTVSNLLALANTAATNAQNFANLGTQQGALDAQVELAKTQAYLALAQQIQTEILQRDAVVTADGQLTTLLASANTAKTAGDAAVAATTTALTTATTNATTVAQQSVIAQYNNPTIVSGNRFGGTIRSVNNLGVATSNESVRADADSKANTTFVLDGNKNLVETRSTGYVSTPGIAGPSVSYADADVKFAGGTAFDNFVAFDPANPNYMALGRWQGGTITADDNSNGVGVDTTVTLGPRSAHWGIAYLPPVGYVQGLTGTTTYTKLANTSPTDAAGNVGTLNSATLSADFAAQTVNAGVNVTIASKTLDASVANLPITGRSFQGVFGTVNCAPSCTYMGRVDGTFAGENASGAGYAYDLWSGAGPYTDVIQGVVAFSGPAPAIAPKPAQIIATAYVHTGSITSASTFQASGTTYALDGGGNLLAVADDPQTTDSVNSETTSGGVAQALGSTAPTAGGTVLTFGRWQGGTVSGSDFSGGFANRAVNGGYHWIRGPLIAPFYLPNTLTGTVTYNSSTPTGSVMDQAGTVGTIDAASTFSVNFTEQSVAADIRATTGANTWRGVGSGIRMEMDGRFFASTGSNSPHNLMTVEFNGSAASTFGVMNGSLMGNSADAAGVGFAFGEGATNRAAGVVAFTGPAQPQNASYSVGIISAGKLGAPLAQVTGTSTIGATTLAALDPELINHVDVAINPTSRMVLDDNGYVATFDASVPVATPVGCTGAACNGISYAPARMNSNGAASFAAILPPATSIPATPGLTNTDNDYVGPLQGSGSTGTGISWGRYTGYFDYADRITTANNSVSTALLDARTSNWHGIWVHNQVGPPVLPVSGTFNYTMIGGTRASDSLGNVQSIANAALATSATLSANFTAMTVNASVNAIVGTNTWSANNINPMPIVAGTYFEAQKTAAGGNLSVTCTGSCAGATTGRIIGAFTGNAVAPVAGNAPGAMMGYALNAGGVAGVTVQGVKAFAKP